MDCYAFGIRFQMLAMTNPPPKIPPKIPQNQAQKIPKSPQIPPTSLRQTTARI